MSNWLITYQWSCSTSGYDKNVRVENELIEIHPVKWLRQKAHDASEAMDKLMDAAAASQGQDDDLYLDEIAKTKYQILWALPVSDEIFGSGSLSRLEE
jgi:hypothetical protein